MGYSAEKSARLYDLMVAKGYPGNFSRIVAGELNTDFTAGRMISYISNSPLLPLEEVADEMLSILQDRDAIIDLKQSAHAQHVISMMYRFGLDDDGSDEGSC